MTPDTTSPELTVTDAMRDAALQLAQRYHEWREASNLSQIATSAAPIPTAQPRDFRIMVKPTGETAPPNTPFTRLSAARESLKAIAAKDNADRLAPLNRTHQDRLLHKTLNQLTRAAADKHQLAVPHQDIYYGPQIGLRHPDKPQILLP